MSNKFSIGTMAILLSTPPVFTIHDLSVGYVCQYYDNPGLSKMVGVLIYKDYVIPYPEEYLFELPSDWDGMIPLEVLYAYKDYLTVARYFNRIGYIPKLD